MIVPNMSTGMEFITLKLQTGLLHSTLSPVDILRRPCHGISRTTLLHGRISDIVLCKLNIYQMLLEAFGVKQSIP